MSSTDLFLALSPPSGGLAALAARSARYEVVGDVDACLGRLDVEVPDAAAHPRGSGTAPGVSLVAVDATWIRPLSVVRRLRAEGHEVPVALVVPAEDLDATGATLSLLPDAGEVAVVPFGDGDLHRRLEQVSRASRQQRKVRGALDAMNRALAGGGRPDVHRGTSRVSEHYLAALVRHAADTIVAFDGRGRVVTVNAAAERALRLPADAMEGRPVGDLLGEDDPGELAGLLAAAAAGEDQVRHDLPVHLRDGRRAVFSATAAAIRDDTGALAGFALIARDVTEERQTEQRLRELQKAESLATLASGVAHDFNNLLMQVEGWSELARRSPADEGLVTEALANIGLATRQAAELSRAMLVYGGQGRFEARRLELDGLLAELRPLLAASVPPKIDLRLDATVHVEVRADPTQLRQIVLNLVVNATEAIGEAGGTIVVRSDEVTVDPPAGPDAERPVDGSLPVALPEGRYGIIEVVDSGPGIDPEHRPRVFDPFFTTKFTGRGLGLAASQGIARASGGAITVDDAPDGGARFRVHLPAIPTRAS